ncbi:MAG TPA: F0F1 ATP synthase subunit delta [Alphaproteobacteria bacterium]|nr:F0F1 ATP synthase subunit delta [Alphaproteobacteria bacterium]
MADAGSSTSGVAERYATALFDLADEQKQLDEVATDLASLRRMLVASPELRRMVRNPLMSRALQGAAMEAVMARANLSPLTRRFVGLVAAKRRLWALTGMIDAYLAELARRRGEMDAQVTSAQPLAPAQVAALEDSLKAAMGKKVAVKLAVDPSLIGGMVVRVGSRMVDSSLKTRLNKLRLAMKGVG